MEPRMEAKKIKLATVGKNGQISIGKEYAGRSLEIEFFDDGRALLTPGRFVPDHQAPFFTKDAEEQLARFGAWEAKNEPTESSTDAIRHERDKKPSRKRAGS